MNSIEKMFSARVSGHIVMWSFAIASIANVESFFAHLHPGLPALSWGLGIALGIGLVVMAGILSGMVWDITDPRFQVVLVVTTGLSLLSGGIQAAAYAAHMTSALAAVTVGLALPIIGELGVALAVSAYTQAQRRQRMADAQNQLSDGVRSQIGDAIANIDRSKIEAQVNRAATLVTKAIVDSTIDDMLSDLRKNKLSISGDESTSGSDESVKNEQVESKNQESIDSTESVILDFYSGNPLASQREASRSTGISQPKISRILNRLESEEVIHRNGNGVEILRDL